MKKPLRAWDSWSLLLALFWGFIVPALLLPQRVQAAIPAAYAPLTIQPSAVPGRTEFDLTAAVARARKQGKRLYIYLGANDCPFCRIYESFLDLNSTELVPHFAPYLVVDLRSSLRVGGDTLYLRVGRKSLPYLEFQQSIGDVRTRQVVYPSVWLLDTQLKPLMQMPAGTGTFQTVPEQLEILRLEQ